MNKAPIIQPIFVSETEYQHNIEISAWDIATEAQRDSDHEYYMKLIKEIELECEARLKEQSVIHSMEIEQVKKETAQEIFSPIFAEWIKGVEKPLAATLDDFPYTIMPLTIKDAFAIGVKSFESNILSALDKKE